MAAPHGSNTSVTIRPPIGVHRPAVQCATSGLAKKIGLTRRSSSASRRAKNAAVLAALNRQAADLFPGLSDPLFSTQGMLRKRPKAPTGPPGQIFSEIRLPVPHNAGAGGRDPRAVVG